MSPRFRFRRHLLLLACGLAGWFGPVGPAPAETAKEFFARGLEAQQGAQKSAAPGRALDEAEAFYLEALKLDDHSAATYNNLAQVYIKLGKMDRAEAALQAAVKWGGDRRGFYLENYAAFQAERGQGESAVQLYAQAAAAQPDDNTVHDLLLAACLENTPARLGGFLWEMLDDGRSLQARRCAFRAMSFPSWPDSSKAELLAVVAASLSRQSYTPEEFFQLPVAAELAGLANDRQIGAGAREILQLHGGVWTGTKLFPWWAARGPDFPFERGMRPSQAFQQLALALGRQWEAAGNKAAVGQIYEAMLIFGDPQPDPDVLLQLVLFYYRTNQSERLRQLVEEHEPEIMRAKGVAIHNQDKQKAFEFHAALGLIYSKIGPLGDSQRVASAIYQLEHAVKLTGYEPDPADESRPALTPQLVNLLTAAYVQTNAPDRALALQERALSAFHQADDLIAASQVQLRSLPHEPPRPDRDPLGPRSLDRGPLYADAGTIKVGVLHSLSGTMAISETSMRDVLLFAFDEINARGGIKVGGRLYKIEPVVVDGASDWTTFAGKAKQLLEEDRVAAVFGCWTSISRKSVLPVLEKNNGLLFYAAQYEGEEESQNVFYASEALNQQAMPAVDYALAEGKKKFYLLGTDYVYPQTTNLVLLEYLLSKGVPLENIGGGFRKDESGKIVAVGRYTDFGHTDYERIIAEIKQFAASGDACVISTLNGDTNVPFFQAYAASGLTAKTCPVVSFSISEDEFRGLPADMLAGQLGCWSYFESLETPANRRFVQNFKAWIRQSEVPGLVREGRVTSAPMALSYDGVYLWKAAVEKAGSFDIDQVRAALKGGIAFDGPGGRVTTQKNMHLTKNVYIGETKADGQFKILKSFKDVYGEPWLKGKFMGRAR